MSAAGRRIRLAADLHVLGLRTASEAVHRNLTLLAPSIVRDLRAGGHEHLVADVARWEADVAALAIAGVSL